MKVFMGIGFLLASVGVYFFGPAGRIWWFWMLIPAFMWLGKVIAEMVRAVHRQKLSQDVSKTAIPSARNTGELPPHNDALFTPPPSVTEQTTRQLDPKTDPYQYRDRER